MYLYILNNLSNYLNDKNIYFFNKIFIKNPKNDNILF